MKKSHRIILITVVPVLALALIIVIWITVRPVQITYRDTIEMNPGGSKTMLVSIEKTGSIFTFGHTDFSFGLLINGEPQVLSEYMTIKETGSSAVLPPFGKDQITYVEISTSLTIVPGEYQIYTQPRIAGIPMKRLVTTITIATNDITSPAADDLIPTPAGIYAYRASVFSDELGPDGKPWTPVTEKTTRWPW